MSAWRVARKVLLTLAAALVLMGAVALCGSLVAPTHLRFDFTHPQAVTTDELKRIEAGVNRAILGDYRLNIAFKPLQQAIDEGATALFGEKYGETVRNITIGHKPIQAETDFYSNELCGGTHVDETGDIGLFLITSEGSAAAGIRRIEAVTGRGAYALVQQRFKALKQAATLLATSPEVLTGKVEQVLEELDQTRKQVAELRYNQAIFSFQSLLQNTPQVKDVPVLSAALSNCDADRLRMLADRFRLAGWNVFYLGTDTPVDEIVDASKRLETDLVVLSASTHFNRVYIALSLRNSQSFQFQNG